MTCTISSPAFSLIWVS